VTLSGHSLERNPASQQADEVHRISVFQAFDVFDAMRTHALIWIKFAPESLLRNILMRTGSCAPKHQRSAGVEDFATI